jgi:transposase InsO family protein
MNRTDERVKLFVSWPGMKQEIDQYVRCCKVCQKNKITQNKTKMPLQITTTPDVAWEKCSLDIVGPLTTTMDGNRYILTFQDELSKYTLAVPIPQQNAETVAKSFVEEVVLKFGIPQLLLTDQGSNFLSELFANMCKLLKIKKIKTTAYHPQSNGALERTHRVLVEYLRCYIYEDQTNWDKWLPYAIFVFNTTPHTATGFTPHELMFW